MFFFISSHHIFSSLFGSAVSVAFVLVLVVRVREFDFVSSKKMQNNEDVSEKNCECRKSAIERHINTNWRSLLFSASRNTMLAELLFLEKNKKKMIFSAATDTETQEKNIEFKRVRNNSNGKESHAKKSL